MKKYQIALIVGRFQPFHNGHLYLLKKALLISEKVIFAIGSASIFDENNPLSYEKRKEIIETVVKNERIADKLIKIVPIEDYYNDEKWLKNLREKVGKFDVAMGNNNWTNKILEKAGYKVLKVAHYKRYLYEGWKIRKLIREGKDWEKRVPNHLIFNLKFSIFNKIANFKNVVLGGTFDHLHKGHKTLIKKAFEIGKNVTIGLATEKLYKDKFLSESIETFENRKKSIEKYVKKEAKIISFSDITGGADKEKKYEAIVVSRETYLNALKINQLRQQNKLPLLRIIIVDDVLANDGKLISSERIRAGEIDRNGQVYINIFNKTIVLSELFKEELRKPMGKVFDEVQKVTKFIKIVKPTILVAVGDIISMSLEKEKIIPDLKIIDFKSRRQFIEITGPDSNSFPPVLATSGRLEKSLRAVGSPFFSSPVINKSGTVNKIAVIKIDLTIKKYLTTKKLQTIVINGEEDLLALPTILFAPLNSLVIYGHWQYGIVAVQVTEEIKKAIGKILNKYI